MKKKGTLSITLGLLLIAAALCLTAYNFWDDHRAGLASGEVMGQLSTMIPSETVLATRAANETDDPYIVYPDYVESPLVEMPVQYIDGVAYIGYLDLPTVGRQYPVTSEWDYDKLKTSPCRYSGSLYTDDLVICGHNYSTHFGPIRNLNIGDELTFTDVDGNVFAFVVREVETLAPTEVLKMTSGDWDMTLFTCTTGAQNRVAVRCDRVDE